MSGVQAQTVREIGEVMAEAAGVLLSLSEVLDMAHDACPPGTAGRIVGSLHLGAREARQVAGMLDRQVAGMLDRLEMRLSQLETALLRAERLAEEEEGRP